MMQIITKQQAKEMVENHNSEQIFTVVFIKRSTGELRKMNCRKGVTKYLTGGEIKYNPKDKNLIVVFDMQKKAYRMIALENIRTINMNNSQYEVR
jgi:hypothetical protein